MPSQWPGATSVGNAASGPATGATDNALARFDGTSGRIIQNGLITESDAGVFGGPTAASHTSVVGSGFTNQPAGDAIDVSSSAGAADAGVQITLIGHSGGTDMYENVTLDAAGFGTTSLPTWDALLAAVVSAGTATGTLTIYADTKGIGLPITTIVPPATSAGLETFAALDAYNRPLRIVASGATTKVVGIGGFAVGGATQRVPVTLSGVNTVTTTQTWDSAVQLYLGDLENTRTVTISSFGGVGISALDINIIPIYANNAAALAGGLVIGNMYRTGADPDVLAIVH